MSRTHRTIRNILVLVATQILSWGMTFAVTLFLPKYAKDTGIGQLDYGASFIGVFGVFVALGTSTVLVKNIARERHRAGEYLLAALALRVPLALILCGIACLIAWAMGLPHTTRLIILIYGFGMIFGTTGEVLSSVLQGMELMTRQSAAALLEKALYSGGMLALIAARAPLPAFAAVALVSGTVSILFSLSALQRQGLALPRPTPVTVRALAISGVPFLSWSVFRTLYGQTDPVVLNFVTNFATVGWYGTAFRLVNTTLILPNAVTMALLPMLSQLYAEGTNREGDSDAEDDLGDSDAAMTRRQAQFWELSRRMLWLVLMLAIPVAVTLVCLAPRLIGLLHYPPQFRNAVPVLAVGGLGVIPFYAASALGTTIVACDRQAKLARPALWAACLGVPACFAGSYLGHRFWGNGAVGAIASDVLLELFLVRCYLGLLPKGAFGGPEARRMARLPLAALPMLALLILAARGGWGGIWIIAPGFALYGGALLLLGCVDREYLSILRGALARKTG